MLTLIEHLKGGKMKKKYILSIVVVIILCIIIFLIGWYNNKYQNSKLNDDNIIEDAGFVDYDKLNNAELRDGIKYNTSDKIKEKHSFENFTFSNLELYSKNGYSYVEFNVEYNKNSKFEEYHLGFSFYDENNELIYMAAFKVNNKDIKEGTINFEIPLDIINAYDYTIDGYKL
jgi:hypothetical protein